ncbi:histidine--tRNA ligase [Patescibacteria group bacterium]|nr:histidine--tRNA ligase [Patescibacteria group bacterium]
MTAKQTLSTQPPRGTYDWPPEEYKVRKHIFDTWRRVCTRFGYEEYLTPLVEDADLYRAKSGEDVGGKELALLEKRGDIQLAIRPEMTPSVTRMVSKDYVAQTKPIRLFSIANFFRNEKPQRGRNREFWQLNYDIFGEESINADIEVIQIALEIMLAFNPPKDSFVIYVNDRRLINAVLESIGVKSEDDKIKLVRLLDKWDKMEGKKFGEMLTAQGVNDDQIGQLIGLMKVESNEGVFERLGLGEAQDILDQSIHPIMSNFAQLGYADWLEFKPSLIRGFDYYDGMVFEVFDKSSKNNRSLFGGGRYNALAGLFGADPFPAVGCAPGDETIKLFLEEWGLIDKLQIESSAERVFIPLLDESFLPQVLKIARSLRQKEQIVETGLKVERLRSALSYADKKEFDKVLIFGEEEKSKGIYVVKDMKTGKQEEVDI